MARILNHGRKRMAARGISEEEVLQVLDDYDQCYPSSEPGRTVFVKTLGGRRIAVVAMPDAQGEAVVVTTFVQ